MFDGLSKSLTNSFGKSLTLARSESVTSGRSEVDDHCCPDQPKVPTPSKLFSIQQPDREDSFSSECSLEEDEDGGLDSGNPNARGDQPSEKKKDLP